MTINDSLIGWAIGVSVAIMSFGIVVVLGYQIYNAFTIEKKIQDTFDKRIEKVQNDLSKSGILSTTAALYQAQGINLKLSFGIKDYEGAIKALESMLNYAITLNDSTINDVARLIVNADVLLRKNQANENLYNNLSCIAEYVLKFLPADDKNVPRLLELAGMLKGSQTNQKTECSRDEGN